MMLNTTLLSPSDQTKLIWDGIKWWLDDCTKNHPQCRQQRDKSWKPARLLHLRLEDDSIRVHLVEGEEIPHEVEYLTLSHCWGKNTPLRLTTKTLDSFKSHILFEDLPKTFKDACQATERLGHKYLWIDSLCIIQDDLEDWAVESGRMASIYGNSFLNLAAAAANNGDDGLFDSSNERDRECWLPVRINRKWGGPFAGNYYVCNYRDWWTKLDNSPLNRRAWVLQERVLAPRVISFGLEQIAFECPYMSACERLPFGDLEGIGSDTTRLWSRLKGVIAATRREEAIQSWDYLRMRWNDVVRSYSLGKLTVETDKLVALDGIADTFTRAIELLDRKDEEEEKVDKEAKVPEEERAKEEDDTNSGSDKPSTSKKTTSSETLFLGGLWKPQMEMQLGWRATSQVMGIQVSGRAPSAYGKRPSAYVAPTWSWCYIKDVMIEPQQANPFDLNLAKVLDVDIKHVPTFKDSDVKSGLKYCCAPGSSLRLQCSFVPIVGFGNFGMMSLPNFKEEGGEPVELQTKNYWDLTFQEEATKMKSPCIVPLFVDLIRVSRAVYGLILDLEQEEGEDGKKYFVRRGAFVLDDDIKLLWDAIEEFDRGSNVFAKGTESADGIYRPKEDYREYEKKDGILQRIIEIR